MPLSKIAQLQSPRANSFNQSLSWPYIFRRQIDITTYQLLYFLSDTSLCLFGDDLYAILIINTIAPPTPPFFCYVARKDCSKTMVYPEDGGGGGCGL